LNDYGAFLHNYGRATDTVKRRCQNSPQFAGITSDIKLKSLQGQSLSLEDLLHKPVARVQKNALVLDDLLSCSLSPSDQEAIREALHLTKTFLDSFNMIETKKMFGHEDRAQRRLVKVCTFFKVHTITRISVISLVTFIFILYINLCRKLLMGQNSEKHITRRVDCGPLLF